MIKLILWILLLAGFCYGTLCLYLYLRQRSILYYPHSPTNSAEADVLWLENEEQRIKIWTVQRSSSPALIYFGGNAEDVSINLPFFKKLAPDYSLYFVNYRGFGGSSGTPSETSLYADSLAVYDMIKNNHDEIVVMGRSLGTGIATYLAAHREVNKVVLVTPFSSMAALASHHYPLMPVSPLIKDRYESDKHAAEITVPVLALIAENDEIIPRKIGTGLVESFKPGVADSIVIARTGHNNIEQSPDYRLQLERFINTGSLPR